MHPTGVVFSDGASSVVVAGQALAGSSLYSYGDVSGKPVKGKASLPEIQWEHPKIHGMESVLNLSSAVASYGSADGSTIIASCSEGGSSCYFIVGGFIHGRFCDFFFLLHVCVWMGLDGCYLTMYTS